VSVDNKTDIIREAAENSLETFITLVAPHNVMGHVHRELCSWWTKDDSKDAQLVLLPRDHGKSRYLAYWCAWQITKNPAIRILYISATSNLAEKQLKFIKDILTSKIYRRYWPEMINKKVSEREKWTNSEICVDHPKRAKEGIRDSTVFTGGLTTSLTGLHCDVAALDDVVVQENAQTEEGRNKVKAQYSLLASIQGAQGREMAVGTRYHPLDLYNDMLNMNEDLYDEVGEVIGQQAIYEVFQRQVEDLGDGTGEFLWPRQQRADGAWFGFNRQILAKKRGKYLDRTQFRSQYYNDPNDTTDAPVGREYFQYYDRRHLEHIDGSWKIRTHKGVDSRVIGQPRKLNLVASVDFAYSLGKRSDYTAIVVLGIDSERNRYVLDIRRFKTTKISEYFDHILELYNKWGFRKLIAETNAAQKAIVDSLKHDYIRQYGLNLSVIEHKPTRHQGSKEERLQAILEPAYQNLSVWHYKGGNCQTLEEELILKFPPHDDVKDALATAIEHAQPPSQHSALGWDSSSSKVFSLKAHPRFGGMAG